MPRSNYISDWLCLWMSLVIPIAAIVLLVRRLRRGVTWTSEDEQPERRCPICDYDLRATPNQCPECGTVVVNRRDYFHSLAHDWPDSHVEPRPFPSGEALVEFLNTDNPMEADLIEQQLTARGIPCVLEKRPSLKKDVFMAQSSVYFAIVVAQSDLLMARKCLFRAQGIIPEMQESILSGERKVVVM